MPVGTAHGHIGELCSNVFERLLSLCAIDNWCRRVGHDPVTTGPVDHAARAPPLPPFGGALGGAFGTRPVPPAGLPLPFGTAPPAFDGDTFPSPCAWWGGVAKPTAPDLAFFAGGTLDDPKDALEAAPVE